jgi:hypothetical protein
MTDPRPWPPASLVEAGFRSLDLMDRAAVTGLLEKDPPRISELTFTNLFMWRRRYRTVWCAADDCLVVVLTPPGQAPFALPPHGPGDRARALDFCRRVLAPLNPGTVVRRADGDFVDQVAAPAGWRAEPDLDQSDYVYLTSDLIHLAGKNYHRKKNHLNQFLKNYDFEYRPLTLDLVDQVLAMQNDWCTLRQCALDPELVDEDQAIHEALTYFDRLGFSGGAILIDGRIAAFTLGERLNPETAVIHIEKADPDVLGLYAAINQRFCQESWAGLTYVNREQDLGLEGLRQAKLSYRPALMIDKFDLTPPA